MQPDPTFTAFFGDKERSFRLTPDLVTELERITGQGIGGFSRRFFGGDFKHADLMAVLRLALIGGGETPQRASELLDAFALRRPLMEVFPLAVGALELLMFGGAKADADDAPFKEAAE